MLHELCVFRDRDFTRQMVVVVTPSSLAHGFESGRVAGKIDEFLGENAGLVDAEIELPAEDAVFDKPEWAGEEVTHDLRYFNSNLVKQPYSTWK